MAANQAAAKRRHSLVGVGYPNKATLPTLLSTSAVETKGSEEGRARRRASQAFSQSPHQPVGDSVPYVVYNHIDINQISHMTGDQQNALTDSLVAQLPVLPSDYLSRYRKIATSGQRNCGIYVSDADPTRLVKCTGNSQEVLAFLMIQKNIRDGKLPADIIPQLYSIYRAPDSSRKFFIAMSRETGSISDYVFDTYVPSRIRQQFPLAEQAMTDIYQTMLPRTGGGSQDSISLQDWDVPALLFLFLDAQELEVVQNTLLKQEVPAAGGHTGGTLWDAVAIISASAGPTIVEKVLRGSGQLLHALRAEYTNKQKTSHDMLNGIQLPRAWVEQLAQNTKSAHDSIDQLVAKFSSVKPGGTVNYFAYLNFITGDLSRDLERRLRKVRYQVFLTDMYLLEVCRLYQADRKMDNWLVRALPTDMSHLGKDHVAAEFQIVSAGGGNRGEEPSALLTTFLYVKVGDPEQTEVVADADVDRYKDMIGRQYFVLGTKQGQYPFDVVGQKCINTVFANYLSVAHGIDKQILQILASDFTLTHLTDVDGRQAYNLLKEGTVL